MSIVVTVETERNERIDELVDEDGHLGRLVAELMPPALLGESILMETPCSIGANCQAYARSSSRNLLAQSMHQASTPS